MARARIRTDEEIPLYKAFNSQRCHARDRGIEFKFSFPEWLRIWRASGKLAERGRLPQQYCMARFGDVGAYETTNIKIITNLENWREGSTGRRHSEETKQKISIWNKGKIGPQLGKPRTEDEKRRISEAHKKRTIKPPSLEQRLRLSQTLRGRVSKRKGRHFKNGEMEKLVAERVKQIRQLQQAGVCYHTIAAQLGISTQTIRRDLKRMNNGKMEKS